MANSYPEYDVVNIDVTDDMNMPATITSYEKRGRSTQRPNLPEVAYKDACERGKREIRTELIDTFREAALKAVHFEETDLSQLVVEVVASKKWISSFGVNLSTTEDNPLLDSLVKDYKECMSKEKAHEVKRRQQLKRQSCLLVRLFRIVD